MRHRLAGAILALTLGARPGVAQAPLTPIDSAILNSQPLKRLVLAASLFRRLSVLAAGLRREVVLCLQGGVSGGTAVGGGLVVAHPFRAPRGAGGAAPRAAGAPPRGAKQPWARPPSRLR